MTLNYRYLIAYVLELMRKSRFFDIDDFIRCKNVNEDKTKLFDNKINQKKNHFIFDMF